MSQLLQYNYAVLDENGRCGGVVTYSVEVPLDNYILIPELNNDYYGKYYSYETELFYYDIERTQIFDPYA